jgi:murein DD-endopeptidase MepM/ murein hydrolase activator NlpD
LLTDTRDGWTARPRNWFPARELIVRSQGQVRFIQISGRLQAIAAAFAAALALAWLAAMATMIAVQLGLTGDRAALAAREAHVATVEGRIAAEGVAAAELARRQRFLEQAVESQVGELSETGVVPTAQTTTIGANDALPLDLSAIEARQFALAERLTQFADARSAAAEKAIRRVGLNPRMLSGRFGDRSAQGGPLLALTAKGQTLDPRFARLGASLARLSALQRGLDAIPSHLPASLEFISSGFGYRSDPITGEPAMHAGLDFRGPIGAPVHAAAAGTVSFAGVKSGYGNCLEISHGNGVVTRYAHMSAFKAAIGQKVSAGDAIGAIGNTGRSTGPHLHFEVRINDRAVNPRPFLQART